MVNVLLEAQVDKILAEMDGHREELYTYFRWQQDDFFPINKWPDWAREGIINKKNAHRKGNLRYNLWVFFVVNGLHPVTAGHWVLCHHVSRDGKRLIQGNTYDKKAREQVFKYLPRQLAEKRLGSKDKPVFDMILGRPEPLGDLGY